jgi:ADP-ribosylglycohydrolase
MDKRAIGRDILLGLAIGDALGVPVEFMDRESIRRNPVKDMRAYGTHHQPAGTFSDDSSLAFCLAAALTEPFTLQAMANKFVAWLNNGYCMELYLMLAMLLIKPFEELKEVFAPTCRAVLTYPTMAMDR